MKILYLSVHEILEYDEVSLLTEMGHDVFSLGAYTVSNKGGQMRGEIPNLYQNEPLKAIAIQSSKEHLHPELVAWADIVISMHNPGITDAPEQSWIANNWYLLQGKRTIWRSIGQSTHDVEIQLSKYKDVGLQVVRYSPKERNIPAYCGENAMIRFYKEPEEFKGWTGEEKIVVNFSQSLKKRGDHCGYLTFMKGTEGLNRKVYGPGNDDLREVNGGLLTYEQQKEIYRRSRVYFYYGTAPASYTLTLIEAMMTGIPVVAASPVFSSFLYQQNTNEIEDIIQNGRNGFIGNTVDEIKDYIQRLFDDDKLAKDIGEAGRRTAIQLFAKSKIKKEWEEFLSNGK
jgi:hypothetical protein